MADETEQSLSDELLNEAATSRDQQASELSKTRQAILISDAMNTAVAPLAATLPTQSAPIGAPRGNSYIGPNIAAPNASPQQFFRDNPFLQGTNSFITPPELSPQAQAAAQRRVAFGTGGESDASRLARLQAADRPGTRTIGTYSESPFSDASLANQRNVMLFNARKRFDAGERSPELMALLLGVAPRSAGYGTRPFQQPKWVSTNPVTGAPGHFESSSGTVHIPASTKPVPDLGRQMEARSLYSEKTTLTGLIASPNTNPKQVPALQKQLDTVNARIKEIFPPSTTETEQSSASEQTKTRAPVVPPAGGDKVSRAKEMRLRHPDFTKQQIIDAVNREFK